MNRLILSIPFLALCLSAHAETKTFALVPKFMNHPFFEQSREGCQKADEELKDSECLFIGPSEPDEQAQLQIVQDLITRKVAGIAVAPANAPAMAKILKKAKEAKIPVVTWDSDLLEPDHGLRVTYVGTPNYQMGRALGESLLKLKPEGGGIFALQSGGAAAANLNERMQGVRDVLKDKGWSEAVGTPLYCNDDSALAVQQMTDLLLSTPDLSAFVPTGAWPQTVHRAYRSTMTKYREKLEKRALIVVAGDTLPMQIDLLREGLSQTQVGQRPKEMGYRAIMTLEEIVSGKKVADPIHTGLDICTAATLSSCMG